jgi:hypothetical protein
MRVLKAFLWNSISHSARAAMAGSLLLLILQNTGALAQSVLEENALTNQLWTDINFSYQLTERSAVLGDIGFRSVSPHEWNRYVIRPAFRYQIPNRILKNLKLKKELIGGIGFFYTSNFNAPNRLEIRPFQGFRLDWPDRPRIRIRHFVRLEERFEMNTDGWKNTFGLRLRYLAELTIRFQGDIIKYNKVIYIPVSAELFWNLIGTNQFNDHVRVSSGIGYTFSEKWKGEFHIAYHYTRNTVEEDFNTNDIVYRLRAFYRIK